MGEWQTSAATTKSGRSKGMLYVSTIQVFATVGAKDANRAPSGQPSGLNRLLVRAMQELKSRSGLYWPKTSLRIQCGRWSYSNRVQHRETQVR